MSTKNNGKASENGTATETKKDLTEKKLSGEPKTETNLILLKAVEKTDKPNPVELQSKIERINELKRKTDRLSDLTRTKQELSSYASGNDTNDERLKIVDAQNNSFSFSNSAIIKLVIDVLKNEINSRISSLEAEIFGFKI